MFTSLRLPLIGLLSFTLAQTGAGCRVHLKPGPWRPGFANECGVCHSVSKGMAGMMGPNLAGLMGVNLVRWKASTTPRPCATKTSIGKPKTSAQLIAQPQAFVPGTYMPYMGLASADDRQAVV